MLRILALMTLILAASWATANPILVNCDGGQSLNQTLSSLDKHTPVTVSVKGTCTEFVHISGFDGLTVRGLPGATLQQPGKDPDTGLYFYVLKIEASRSVTIDGFRIHSAASASAGIGVRASTDVRLRNLAIDGAGVFGIQVFENSQVSIARVTARDPGYSTVGVYNESNVQIENCLFEHSTGEGYHVGVDVSTAHVIMHGTTIRNMQSGLNVNQGGEIDVQNEATYYPVTAPSDVIIESPAGTNFWGVAITNGGVLNLNPCCGGAKLRIANPGQFWSTGVLVDAHSTLNAGAQLVVSGSRGHGVLVSNNSHASLAGSRITGSSHGGLVAVNLSTIAVGSSNPLTQITGNAVDLFCDSRSLITGGANIANATGVQCTNLLPGDFENLP